MNSSFGVEIKSTPPHPSQNRRWMGHPVRAQAKAELQSELPRWHDPFRRSVSGGNHGHEVKGGPPVNGEARTANQERGRDGSQTLEASPRATWGTGRNACLPNGNDERTRSRWSGEPISNLKFWISNVSQRRRCRPEANGPRGRGKGAGPAKFSSGTQTARRMQPAMRRFRV